MRQDAKRLRQWSLSLVSCRLSLIYCIIFIMSHKYYIIILLGLGLLTHFIFFGHPNSTVFDEVHFGKFLSAYYTHEYYYDIHPPLGKLIIAGFANFFGYKPEFTFNQIGDTFPNKTYLALRFLPSLAGALLPVVIYLIALRLGIRPLYSFFAGTFIVLDNGVLTQSRYILMDGFLYLFGFLCLLFYLRYRQNESNKYINLLLISIFGALAASIKWTGLTFLALAGLFELYSLLRSSTPKLTWKLRFQVFFKLFLFFGAIPLAIYFSFFVIHFSLLPKSGPGDAFMDVRFQKILQGNPNQNNPSLAPMNLWEKFIDLNKQMYLGNTRLTATHPYGSKWYTWPFMSRSIYYWVKDDPSTGSGQSARIYYLGNPVIWWSSTVAVLVLFINYLLSRKDRNFTSSFLLTGYILNLLPFLQIKRVMFLYHYAIALIFAILMLVYFFDKENKPIWALTILLILTALSFIFFSPLSYGLNLSPEQYQYRVWFSSWL